jgi:hypothetical protein
MHFVDSQNCKMVDIGKDFIDLVDIGKGLVDFQFHHGGRRRGFCKFSIVG